MPDPNRIRDLAGEIGYLLKEKYPAVCPPGYDRPIAIRDADTEAIADEITLVVADILQAWLDAGSERDVTLEELTGPIHDHVKGWAVGNG